MDLNEIQIFLKIADKHSFIRASEELDIPPSTISRKLAELEKRLSVTLIERTTRKLKLTEYGEIYYNYCSSALEKIQEANELINQKKLIPKGRLRISASIAIGTEFLHSWIMEFIDKYPEINVELILDNKYIDFISEGFDIIFRVDPADEAGLKGIKVATSSYILCCSDKYLLKNPEPKNIEDLKTHNCILVSNNNKSVIWEIIDHKNKEIQVNVSGNFKTNILTIATNQVLAGKGIGYLPYFIVQPYILQNKLKVIMKNYNSKKREIFAIYSNKPYLAKNINLFIDFIKNKRKKLNIE